MGQPLSMDLRRRLLAAIDDGMSCRSAASRFGIAPSTAIRWVAQRRETGSFAPKPQGGDMRGVASGDPLRVGCARTSRLKNCVWRCRSWAYKSRWPSPLLRSSRHDAQKTYGHAIEQDRLACCNDSARAWASRPSIHQLVVDHHMFDVGIDHSFARRRGDGEVLDTIPAKSSVKPLIRRDAMASAYPSLTVSGSAGAKI